MTQKDAFVGKYIQDIELALIASAVSGSHSLLLGAPGWGKTAIARSMGEQITKDSKGAFTFTRFATTTPPEMVTGPLDVSKALADPPDIVYKHEGTPYDKRARLSIFDEIFRPSDVIFDLFLDLLDRQDVGIDLAPTIWSTSNFIVKSERTEALRDRIALWVWVVPDELDVRSIIGVHLNRGYNKRLQIVNGRTLPTIAQIDKIRKSKPTPQASEAVTLYLEILASEADKEGFKINPRRLEQWTNLVYRTSSYLLGGDNDFDDIPADIGKVMKYAYPCFDKEKWIKWQETATAVADPVGSAIETITKDAYHQFKTIQDRGGDKFEIAEELGKVLAAAERSLSHITKNAKDARVEKALNELTDVFGALCRGESPL